MTTIPDPVPIVLSLVTFSHDLVQHSRLGHTHDFYETLCQIERLGAYHRQKMMQRSIIDPMDVDDDTL